MNVFPAKFLNFMIAFVNAILMLFHTSRADKSAEEIDVDALEMTFSDEFDGECLDETKWGAHDRFGVRKGGYWSRSQARTEDGCLVISTRYLPDGEFGPGWYTCGLDTSASFGQTYGYFECRCILPKGEGLWSAFWMFNENVGRVSKNAVLGAELDIMESPFWHFGGKRRRMITQNIHYSGYDLQTRYRNVGIFALAGDPYEEFNTYGLMWTPEEYIFYINRREVARTKYGGVSTRPEFMILSCEVDGGDGRPTFGWSGNIENNDRETFLAEFRVDYVRAYRLPDGGVPVRKI